MLSQWHVIKAVYVISVIHINDLKTSYIFAFYSAVYLDPIDYFLFLIEFE